jgi:hypothetical protein
MTVDDEMTVESAEIGDGINADQPTRPGFARGLSREHARDLGFRMLP